VLAAYDLLASGELTLAARRSKPEPFQFGGNFNPCLQIYVSKGAGYGFQGIEQKITACWPPGHDTAVTEAEGNHQNPAQPFTEGEIFLQFLYVFSRHFDPSYQGIGV
jgi:hypothetical protein